MKAPPFKYHAPKTVNDAAMLLATLPNARVLAGGQSLMPMLNLRVAAPDHLIDLNRIEALRDIMVEGNTLITGAMCTQRSIERSELVAQHCPLLHDAITHVGHQQTRNRGTVGGSISHLDPGAELPVIVELLVCCRYKGRATLWRHLPRRCFLASHAGETIGQRLH